MRIELELFAIASSVRSVIPTGVPLFLRISATEWLEHVCLDSWDLPSSIELSKLLPSFGIDFLDVNSGGNNKDQKVDLAGEIRRSIRAEGQKTLVGAVGLITQPDRACKIVQNADKVEAVLAESMLSGSQTMADAILLGRQFLRERDWVINAATALGVKVTLPLQIDRAFAM